MTRPPAGLASGGRALWRDVLDSQELDALRLAVLEQACRQRDRCDTLAAAASNGDPGALRHERDSAMAMTRLLSALRLPDATGRKPQARQVRGVQAPSTPLSAVERARQRHAAQQRP
jgi:hypothetical protein